MTRSGIVALAIALLLAGAGYAACARFCPPLGALTGEGHCNDQ